jgi:hypothetical protein
MPLPLVPLLTLIAAPAHAADAVPPPIDAPPAASGRARKDAAVIIGIEDYASLPDASGARADADAFEALVRARGVELVHRVSDASSAAARAAIGAGARDVKRKGTLWIYVAGHGAATAEGARVLLGAESEPAGPLEGALPLTDIVRIADASRAERTLVVVDASFAGRGRADEPIFAADAHGVGAPSGAAPFGARTSVWLAAAEKEPAPLWAAAGHGVFSYFVVGALQGWADGAAGGTADGKVTLGEAQAYVTKYARTIAGTAVKPGKEARAEAGAWVLAQGNLADGPSRDTVTALAAVEKAARVRKAESEARARATADWAAVSASAQAAGAQSEAALQGFIARWDAAVIEVDGAALGVAIPEVAEARARIDSFARKARKGKRKRPTTKSGSASASATAATSESTAACKDLLALEPAAISGTLAPEQMRCLEARVATDKLQTSRDKVSRMLIVDADARADLDAWARLVERHLGTIDRSDPDLCFKWALHLSRGSADEGEEVLRWIEYALENKHVWEGPRYVSRVYGLLQLRAETATRLWNEADADFVEDRSDEASAYAEQMRGRAKDYAREWFDYAKQTDQSPQRARDLCASAAGTRDFCAG